MYSFLYHYAINRWARVIAALKSITSMLGSNISMFYEYFGKTVGRFN